ncbi:hypothetical protein [Plantactinospora sonchi]|uniref:Uncharacterized protein n=1 Tax=Plantactinospora sonchi TaxID=1544735 RepID=A0ABU7RZW2_9ACTN
MTRQEPPEIAPGTVLALGKDDWRYGDQALLLLVEFVRLDLSRYYDNQWVWISGQRLARDGTPMGHLDALVKVSAIPAPQTCDGHADKRAAHPNGRGLRRRRTE